MVLIDKTNFGLNKTGLRMVCASELALVDVPGCLDVKARSLSREQGELLSDWLSVADRK